MSNTATAKIEFSEIKGDRYEQFVDVADHGHNIGELWRDLTHETEWLASETLRYELESIAFRAWVELDDAKRDIIAAADDPENRAARLRRQRCKLAAAEAA